MTDDRVHDVATFALCCWECDAGMHIGSHEQAVAENWTDLSYDPDGLSWTWLGLCPECDPTR